MPKEITIADEIKELERELAMRRRKYPEWSRGPNPSLKPETANRQIAVMEATLERLKKIQGSAGQQTTIFP